MRNIVAFILAAIMSVAIVFIAALLFFPDQEKEMPVETEETPVVMLSVSQSDCRDALYRFVFCLGEEEYALPCRYSDFENNGWVMRNPTEKIKGNFNMTGIYIKKAHRSLKTEIINYSDDTIMCCKGQIHAVSANVGDFETIRIPGAVIFDRNTTPSFLQQKLGEPDASEENETAVTLTYKKEDHKTVQFIFSKKRPSHSSRNFGEPYESGYYEHTVVFECRENS